MLIERGTRETPDSSMLVSLTKKLSVSSKISSSSIEMLTHCCSGDKVKSKLRFGIGDEI